VSEYVIIIITTTLLLTLGIFTPEGIKIKFKKNNNNYDNVYGAVSVISGTGFYGANNPTNSVKALKEDRVLRIRLQYHQLHLTVYMQLTKKHTQNAHT